MKLWTELYKPSHSLEIAGNEFQINEMLNYIKNYKIQRKRAILLFGNTGTGKSSSVYAIAGELDLEVLEINASDLRNKDSIIKVLGGATKQASLFNSGKIILVDEIDGISGTKDRGGIPAIISVLQNSSFPVIITANDPWNSKFSGLRSKCKLIELEKINYEDQFHVLKRILIKENLNFEEEILKIIARRSSGDLRSSINDLQSLYVNRNKITKENLDEISYRERPEEIMNFLRVLFKSKAYEDIDRLANNLDVDFNELFLWVENNMPLEYDNFSLDRGFDSLSKSDLFNGRIRRWQYWRFFVYYKFFMTLGVAMAKDDKKDGFVSYKRNDRILKIWLSKRKYSKRDEIVKEICEKLKISKSKALKEYPYVRKLF